MAHELTRLTTQALLETGCYHLPPPGPDDDSHLIAFNICGWNIYAAVGEPVLLLDSPIGATLGYCFGDDVEGEIKRLKGIIRKCKRDYEVTHTAQHQQLALFCSATVET